MIIWTGNHHTFTGELHRSWEPKYACADIFDSVGIPLATSARSASDSRSSRAAHGSRMQCDVRLRNVIFWNAINGAWVGKQSDESDWKQLSGA